MDSDTKSGAIDTIPQKLVLGRKFRQQNNGLNAYDHARLGAGLMIPSRHMFTLVDVDGVYVKVPSLVTKYPDKSFHDSYIEDLTAYLRPDVSASYRDLRETSGDMEEVLWGILQTGVSYKGLGSSMIFPTVRDYINHIFQHSDQTVDIANDLLTYPMAEGVDFMRAMDIIHSGADLNKLANWFVIHGVSIDKLMYINLDWYSKFFLMTRFYTLPNFDIGSWRNDFVAQAVMLRERVAILQSSRPGTLEETMALRHVNSKKFSISSDKIMEKLRTTYFVKNNGPGAMVFLGILHPLRFLNDIDKYITLKKNNAIEITASDLKANEDDIGAYLKKFNDIQIIEAFGLFTIDNDGNNVPVQGAVIHPTRNAFIQDKVEYVKHNQLRRFREVLGQFCKVNTKDEGIYLDPVTYEPLQDTPSLVVGSFVNGFHCFSIETLARSMNVSAEEGYVGIRIPYFTSDKPGFTTPEIGMITEYLENPLIMSSVARSGVDTKELYKNLDDVNLAILRRDTESDSNMDAIIEWTERNETNTGLMNEMLTDYFHTGMYMRSWEGKGSPYPVSSKSTGTYIGEQSPEGRRREKRIVESYTKYMRSLSNIDPDIQELWINLSLMTRSDTNSVVIPFPGGRPIKNQSDRVFVKRECFRESSRPWVVTGAFYYQIITGKKFPGVNISTGFVHIQ